MPRGSSQSRVPELGFRVFARSLHPDWFAVRAFRRITRDGWEADIRIVDRGHAIHFRAERSWLTEVLAGPETTLPETGLLFHAPVRRERTASLRPGDGVDYQTGFEVERCDPEVFDHLCTEATLDASRDGLYHTFAPTNRLAPAALSLIQLEARAKGLSIHTFHAFPAERMILRTHSLFESRLAQPAH